MNIYFTGDTHFGHANIIKYCNRPFDLVQAHDEALIDNWNSIVSDKDVVYHLGDFCFKNGADFPTYLKRLNGQINLIWGNHDQSARRYARENADKDSKVRFLGDYAKIKIDDQDIILSHYSFRVWDKSHWGSWNLYGHSHGTLSDDPHQRGIDVGVDCHNYRPISFNQVKDIMSKKFWQPIDHHGKTYEEARSDGGGIDLNKEDYLKLERQRLYQQLKKEFEK